MTTTVTHLTVLVPVRPDRVAALRATLTALPTGPDSPFAAVTGTHFARFVVVDHLGAPGTRSEIVLSPPRLLMAVNCDGNADAYLAALGTRFASMIDFIWQECEGFPGFEHPRAFAAWILRYEVAPTLPFATVDANVERVHTATVEHDRLSAFAVRCQSFSPKELRAAWREEFGW